MYGRCVVSNPSFLMKYQMYALIDGKTRYKTTFFRHEIVIQLMYTAHTEKEQYKNIG